MVPWAVPLKGVITGTAPTGPDRTIGYHGSFLVDPAATELKRLTIVADAFPAGEAACMVEDTMDYHRVKIGNGDFLLPEAATMDVLFNEGIESVNEISYPRLRFDAIHPR